MCLIVAAGSRDAFATSFAAGTRQMKLTLMPMTEVYALEIVGWRYPGQYALYNSDPDDAEDDVKTLLNPDLAYYAVWEQEYDLFGFCCYGKDAQPWEDLWDMNGEITPS